MDGQRDMLLKQRDMSLNVYTIKVLLVTMSKEERTARFLWYRAGY